MRKIKIDFLLMAFILLLFGIGVSFIYSSSYIYAMNAYGNAHHFFVRQIVSFILGLFVMYVVARIPYQVYRRLIPYIMVGVIIVMASVFVPGLGLERNGALRWINLGFLTFQPSELAKIATILVLAYFISDRVEKDTLNHLKMNGIYPIIGYISLILGLFYLHSHFSGMMVILLITFILMIRYLSIRNIIIFGSVSLSVIIIAIWTAPYRIERIKGFLNPEASDNGYQLLQSRYALASGELGGMGLGMSRQKFYWLPENHTDFIMSVIGEETGFIGISIIILLFLLLIFRSLWIAYNAPDLFSLLIVFGITMLIFVQSVINFAVVVGMFPVTGMPLPFVSYGGTNLTILMAGIGIVFNVYSQSKL